MNVTFFKDKKGEFYHESELREKPSKIEVFRRGYGIIKLSKKSLTKVEDDLVDDLNDPLMVQYLGIVYGLEATIALLEKETRMCAMVTPGYVRSAMRLPHEPEFYKDFTSRFGRHPFYLNTAIMAAFGIYSFDIVAFDSILKAHHGYKEETHGSIHDFLTQTQGPEFTEQFQQILLPSHEEKLAA